MKEPRIEQQNTQEKQPTQKSIEQAEKNIYNLHLLIGDIDTYNKDHSLGSYLADGILGEEIKRMSLKKFLAANTSHLEEFGLSVEDHNRQDVKVYGLKETDEEIEPSEIRINIENSKKFNNFLNQLNTGILKNIDSKVLDKQLGYSLEKIAESLITQVRSEYNLEDPNEDRLFNLFSGLEEMIKNYERIETTYIKPFDGSKPNLSNSIEPLKKYLSVSREGYMREYMELERQGLFEKKYVTVKLMVDPTQWDQKVNESLVTRHEKTWQRDFQLLDSLNQNKNAKHIYSAFLKELKEGLVLSKANVEEQISKLAGDENKKEVYQKIKNNIDKVEVKLNSYH